MHYGVCRLASLSRPRGENVAHIVEQTSLMRIIIELNSNGPDRSRVHSTIMRARYTQATLSIEKQQHLVRGLGSGVLHAVEKLPCN